MKTTLEKKHQFSISNLPGCLAVLDHTYQIVECSGEWIDLFAIKVGDSVFNIAQFEKNREEWIECLTKALRLEDGFITEHCSLSRNRYHWVIRPFSQNEDNRLIFVQRFLNRTATEERRHKLRHLANRVAGIGYWEHDLEKKEYHWSSMTRIIHQVDEDYHPVPEEVIAFYKEGWSRDRKNKVVDHAIATGRGWNEDLLLIDATGNEVWVNCRGEAQFENGICVRLQGTLQNITPRKLQEQKLRVSEERFKMAFDNTLIACLIIDAVNLKITDVNRAAEKMFGYSKKEFLQKNVSEINHARDPETGMRYLERLLNRSINRIEFENTYSHKSGASIVSRVYLSLNFDESGRPLNLIAQILDITELTRKNQEIDKFINQTTRQNSRLVNFAHIVSHNLRSHSSNISMLLEFMEAETDETERQEQFCMLKQASYLLSETIDNLNEVVVVDTSDRPLEPIDLGIYIRRILNSSHGMLIKSDFKVYNEVPEGIVVLGVPAYMDSIFLNLLTNAIKYRSREGDSWLRFSAKRKNGLVVIKAQDNGQGIDLKRYGDRIFGMYKTFHNNPDSRGLGLYMTKSQIEVMGGTISVESEVNVGTTFKIKLNEEN